MLSLLGLVPCLPLFVCVWRLTRRRGPDGRVGRLDALARAVGWLALCALVAVAYQVALLLGGGTSTSFELDDMLSGLPFSWWVLLGGESVQSVFEATVKDLTGHRQSTMLDNWPYYVGLTYAQTLVLGGLAALRLRAGRGLLDPWLLALGLAVIVNGCLGARWPWWGT